ncbi:RTA1 like protein-domain-containing protein [Cadophora sp. MPI-SDFR-AT-0126]|nr:RTA1 like protein-domain-containing protein [Leotiomycetes sp. MPI-SDFR-AT-0126]
MSSGRPNRGYIDPNFPNPMGPGDASIIIYGYTPNFTLCILGIVFFTLLFFAHLFQMIRVRLWSFLPLVIACVMEVVGYAFRALSSRKNPYHISYFVVQYFLIVTAPVLTSASIYVCLTKVLVWAADEGLDLSTKTLLLRKKIVLWAFITIDVFCTILQITGAGLIGGATSKGKDPSTANNILLAGLAIQTAAYFVYLSLLVVVITAIYRVHRTAQKAGNNPFLGVLALASTLIFIRTIFRLAETSQGVFGHLSSHEGYFAGLEFAPVVAALTILAVWFPSRWPVVTDRVKVEGV